MRLIVRKSPAHADRYIPVAVSYSDAVEGIPFAQIGNIYDLRPSGESAFNFLHRWLHLGAPWIVKTGPDAYTVDIRPEDILVYKLTVLKRKTFEHVTSDFPGELRMPIYRQNNAHLFIRLYEKKNGGTALDASETAIYNAIIDTVFGETETECYDRCKARIAWIGGCMQAHDALMATLLSASTPEEVEAIEVTAVSFPQWVG